jgi:hypothetical protein
MLDALEKILAGIGALACVMDAVIFWQYQAGSGELWPLPALVLIEVALLGLTGLLAVSLDSAERSLSWGRVTWIACGALAGLMVLGAFTIGMGLVPAVIAFSGAAVLADRRRGRRVLPQLGGFGAGILGSALLLLILRAVSGLT